MSESEFSAIIISDGEPRPLMSKPRRLQATKKFIRHVQDNLQIPDAQAFEAADWILNLMERYGARAAKPIFTMEGSGPCCSWCGTIWPLCGHHHMSESLSAGEQQPRLGNDLGRDTPQKLHMGEDSHEGFLGNP